MWSSRNRLTIVTTTARTGTRWAHGQRSSRWSPRRSSGAWPCSSSSASTWRISTTSARNGNSMRENERRVTFIEFAQNQEKFRAFFLPQDVLPSPQLSGSGGHIGPPFPFILCVHGETQTRNRQIEVRVGSWGALGLRGKIRTPGTLCKFCRTTCVGPFVHLSMGHCDCRLTWLHSGDDQRAATEALKPSFRSSNNTSRASFQLKKFDQLKQCQLTLAWPWGPPDAGVFR